MKYWIEVELNLLLDVIESLNIVSPVYRQEEALLQVWIPAVITLLKRVLVQAYLPSKYRRPTFHQSCLRWNVWSYDNIASYRQSDLNKEHDKTNMHPIETQLRMLHGFQIWNPSQKGLHILKTWYIDIFYNADS